jgi:hypothetical protein
MPIDQARVASITAAVLAAVAAVASIGAWIGRQKPPPQTSATAQISNGRMHIDSPITASGGSMTFRSQSPWNPCIAPTGTGVANISSVCITSASFSGFTPTHLYRGDGQGNFFSAPSYGRISGSETGKVTFYMRLPNGDPGAAPTSTSTPSTPYIVLCTSNSPNYDMSCGGGTNYVQVQVYKTATSNPILVSSNAAEPSGSSYSPQQTYAIQYFDPGCPVHGTSSTAPNPVPACEHPGWVTWVDKQSYLCVQGLCSVSLDP